MTDFLPTSYKIPDNSGYLKLKDGDNTFRVLSSAIIGWEFWNNENKPVRSRTPFKTTPNIKLNPNGQPTKVKHFWSFCVYNYNSEAIQILEITQSTIQSAIKAIVDNKKWGDPKTFDLTITRIGNGIETEYSTMPNPKSEIDPAIIEDFKSRNINLEALYDGANPFGVEKGETEPTMPDSFLNG